MFLPSFHQLPIPAEVRLSLNVGVQIKNTYEANVVDHGFIESEEL